MSPIANRQLLLLWLIALVGLGGCRAEPGRLALFVGPSASSFVDPTGTMTIDDVARRRQELFKSPSGEAPNEGISGSGGSRFWLTFVPPETRGLLEKGWSPPFVLTIPEPRIQRVDLYIKSPTGTSSQTWSGRDARRMSGEGFRYPVFIIDPQTLADAEVFLGIQTSSSMQGLVWLSDFQSFFGMYDAETLTLSITIGIMSAILIYILALGLFLRSRTNLWLAASIFSGLVYVVSSNGFLETVFLQGAATMSRVLALASAPMIYCSFTGFMANFLRLRTRLPSVFPITRLLAVVLAIFAVLSIGDDLLGIGILRHVSAYLGLGTIFFALVVATLAARKNLSRSFVFLLAWSPAMVAGLIRLFLDVAPQSGVSPALGSSLLFGIAASLVLFTIVASIDIQQRESRLKGEILHNANRFRAFAEIGTDVFWEIDGKGCLSFFTGHLVGPPRFQMGGHFVDQLASATSLDAVEPLRAAILAGRPIDDRRLCLAEASDRDFWISISGRPILHHDMRDPGRQASYRGLIRDVTEETERESRRVIEQQMFALGQLAGSVAHEINNLIHPIINLTKRLRLRSRPEADEEGGRMLDLIDISSRQAAKVVSELLHTMRGERLKDIDRPIAPAVTQGVEVIRPALPSSVRIELAVEELELPVVRAGDILQIVGNLFSNAVHAMNGQGTIRVSLTAAENGVKLAVADNGAGMDDRVRRRALQPFFSTKTDGRGTGVGLYIVQRIVGEYNGRINIESSPGHGTTVTIFFPATKDNHGTAEDAAYGTGG